jgi:hypothetical protein
MERLMCRCLEATHRSECITPWNARGEHPVYGEGWLQARSTSEVASFSRKYQNRLREYRERLAAS